jgi:hypothetical protein
MLLLEMLRKSAIFLKELLAVRRMESNSSPLFRADVAQLLERRV